MDANADRVILMSTAETHPAGTFFFTDYELVLLQFGYAITDQFQIALTGLPPLVEDQPYFFDLTAKLNLTRGPVFRAAAMGAFELVFDDDGDALYGFRAGGVGQFCFVATCQSSVSINLFTFFNDDIDDYFPVIASAGLSAHLSDLFSILVEPIYAFVIGDRTVGLDGFILNYGIRLSGDVWGLDITLIRPIGEDFNDSELILGVPWLSFTYRTDLDGSEPAPAPAPTTASLGRALPF